MVELEAIARRREGVTLVRATVRNDRTTTQRVRLRSRLEGSVWAPRRRGVVEPEWTDHTWEGTVAPGRHRGVGFASPAEPVESPVELVEATRADGDSGSADVRTVLSSLTPWAPPERLRDGDPGEVRRR